MKVVSFLGLLALPAALHAQTLPGAAELDDARLHPGSWEMSISMKQGDVVRQGGTTRYELSRTAAGEWLLMSSTTSQVGVSTDSTLVEAGTLRPLTHRSHAARGTMFLDFDGTRVRGTKTPQDSATRAIDHTTEVPTFDSAFMEVLLGALPLETGYATRLPFFIHERGGLVWADVEVAGQAMAGSTPAWAVNVALAGFDVAYLIDRRTRQPLGGNITYPNGALVEMKRPGGSGH